MQQLKFNIVALAVASTLMAGCGTVADIRDEIREKQPTEKKSLEVPFQIAKTPRVVEMSGNLLPVTEITMSSTAGAWFKSKMVSLDAPNAISVQQAVAKLAAQGLNISSDLPLDTFMFSGVINKTDAESALRQILASAGLDFSVDDAHQLVTIKPLSSRTWYLNIGNRKSSYSSAGIASVSSGSGASSQSGGGSSGGSYNGGNSQSTQVSQQSGGASSNGGAQASASTTQISSSSGMSGTGVSISDDFWGAMDRELSKRLTVLIPAPRTQQNQNRQSVQPSTPIPFGAPLPGTINGVSFNGIPSMPPSNAGNQVEGSAELGLYVSKRIGSYSLNPETGAISVQAPKWILGELDSYLKRIQLSYNTDISFEGRLILITSNKTDSEGLDIQSFAKWATGRYGAIVSNNTLGGITLGFPNGNIPSVSATNQSVGGALLGITSAPDGLQIFNNYLRELGNVSVLQRPRVTTTSGVPGAFSNITTKVYTVANQSASSGSSGAAVQATTNTIVEKEFGTELRVNPRYDVATSCTRTLITLKNLIYSGDQSVLQVLSSGNSIQTLPSKIPTQRKLNYEGEALLCDGDLIVLGGQSEETLQSDENGLPIGDAPLSGPFGTKKSTKAGATYYFALKVNVRSRQ